MPRYLTKSRFKLASECPTKLCYTGKRDQYADQSDENSFLMILTEGGNYPDTGGPSGMPGEFSP